MRKYSDEELVMLMLDYANVSYKKMQETIDSQDVLSGFFDLNNEAKIAQILGEEFAQKFANKTADEIEKEVTQDLEKFNITAVTIFSENYPELLKQIDMPPMVLYCIGDTRLLGEKCIGVVGTRLPSTYGKNIASKFSEELTDSGLVTVSGLSFGIDTCCAVSSIKSGNHIAVLAGGLDSIYPSQNLGLSKKIAEKGLLVSEYRPYVRPKQYSFLARNRIISGLSLGVLVVEAGLKSGSISTANHAINQGRELFVIPGNITSKQSEGTNYLISEIPDCFTTSVDHILNRLHIETNAAKKENNLQLDMLSSEIVEALSFGELNFDEICEKVKASAGDVSSALVTLEIMGVIVSGPGNTYTLA